MTFIEEVGAPARLSGANIPVVHTLLMAIKSVFDTRKRYKKIAFSSKNRPNWPSSLSVRAILPYEK